MESHNLSKNIYHLFGVSPPHSSSFSSSLNNSIYVFKILIHSSISTCSPLDWETSKVNCKCFCRKGWWCLCKGKKFGLWGYFYSIRGRRACRKRGWYEVSFAFPLHFISVHLYFIPSDALHKNLSIMNLIRNIWKQVFETSTTTKAFALVTGSFFLLFYYFILFYFARSTWG